MSKSIGVPSSGQTDVLVVKGGQRGGGKVHDAVKLQIWDEVSSYPSETPEEAAAFCQTQIKRCKINLANAKDRGDDKAVLHLERKLVVYEYLMQMSTIAVNAETKPMRECPNCKVTSVDIFGLCHCCGKNW